MLRLRAAPPARLAAPLRGWRPQRRPPPPALAAAAPGGPRPAAAAVFGLERHSSRCRALPGQPNQPAGEAEGQQPAPATAAGLAPEAPAAAAAEAAEAAAEAEAAEPAPAAAASQHHNALLQEQRREQAAASRLYLAAAVALAALGALTCAFAEPVAAACIKLGRLPLQHASALVGCFGAALLRAASLAAFVAEGAAAGELGTWRYQKVNVGLAAAAAATAALQLASWRGGQPWLLLALAAAGAAGAAACASSFWRLWRAGRVRFASALEFCDDWEDRLRAAAVYVLRDASSLSGALLAALSALCAVAGVQALLAGAPAAAAAALPWDSAGAGAGGLAYLRRLAGVGLLLAAVQGLALGEYAGQVRRISAETGAKLALLRASEVRMLADGELPVPATAPPQRFALLHAGFFAAAAAQAAALAGMGAGGGPAGAGLLANVNAPDALWAALHWAVLGAGAYAAAAAAAVDWSTLKGAALGAVSYLSGWVSFFAVVLYTDWSWLDDTRRR